VLVPSLHPANTSIATTITTLRMSVCYHVARRGLQSNGRAVVKKALIDHGLGAARWQSYRGSGTTCPWLIGHSRWHSRAA
jgi:hypothetical protein